MSRAVCLVGIGKIALDQHVPALASSPDFHLACTVSRSGRVPGIPAFTSLDTALAAHPAARPAWPQGR